MKIISRHFLFLCMFIVGLGYTFTSIAADMVETPPEHPLKTSKKYTENVKCPNCGMNLNMWARTRYIFENSEGKHETCSLRGMADISRKIGEMPENVQVASYISPDHLIAAKKAVYVVGSKAKGTMTMKSKLAFSGEKEADTFIQQFGGKKASFQEAYKLASLELDATREKIQTKRMKKGKIALPEAQTSCTVCGMRPASYPHNHGQVTTKSGEHLHFCSTKCLENFLKQPKEYGRSTENIQTVYVALQDGDDYEYAEGVYFVVGSNEMGPMGPEAFAFRMKANAQEFTKKHGGKVVRFNELTPEIIMGDKKMGHGGMGHKMKMMHKK